MFLRSPINFSFEYDPEPQRNPYEDLSQDITPKILKELRGDIPEIDLNRHTGPNLVLEYPERDQPSPLRREPRLYPDQHTFTDAILVPEMALKPETMLPSVKPPVEEEKE